MTQPTGHNPLLLCDLFGPGLDSVIVLLDNVGMGRIAVFIDEAGDPGVRDGLRFVGSRHEWMCVSAMVVRAERAGETVDWIKDCRQAANSRQAGALHYHRIHQERREAVCASLATRPCRLFTVATHKTNLREYVNPRLQQMIDAGKFYNWCLRLLLERVTDWVARWHEQEGIEIEPMDVLFASRGHDWGHFFAYVDKLQMQKRTGTLYLRGPGLHPTLLDRRNWSIDKAERRAGLQCADIVASAFYQAANHASPTFDLAPAQALKRIIAERNGSARDCGVTLWPLANQAPIPPEASGIFRFYGYQL